jgi:tRNA 2-selenouridine synthase
MFEGASLAQVFTDRKRTGMVSQLMRPISRIPPDTIADFDFDEIIDVRAPVEFAEDHLPEAINLPVLDDSQRETVGTIYKQESPFEARKIGAALVSANISAHLAGHLASKGKDYRPLIYCWRGGQRSRSMATVLGEVGWRPQLLDGGYKAYRAFVSKSLAAILEETPQFRIIAGLTGSGKTWLLERLAAAGEQVLDLEGLAEHRGSALGQSLTAPQPSQKRFENLLFEVLRSCDLTKPIYVESESSRIGRVQIPAALWTQLRGSPVIETHVPLAARAAYLVSDYQHFVKDKSLLAEKLSLVQPLQTTERFSAWGELIEAGDWQGFVESILEHHYDPAYLRSREKIYTAERTPLETDVVSAESLDVLAREVIGLQGRQQGAAV